MDRPTTPGFRSSLQIFPSASIEATRSFYEAIGFRSESHLDSDQPHVCLYRDAIELVLTRSTRGEIVPNREAHGYGYDAYFIASELDSIHGELKRKGVKFVKELNLTDYANREFVFEDNERRWIAVGRKVDSEVVQDAQLHHVAFLCADIGAMERFYADKLGFVRARTFRPGSADSFFIMKRDNVRIELFPVLAKDHGARFKHFAIGVDSLENTIKHLDGAGVEVDRVIDHSTAEHAFKVCFIRDPEGNVIEFMEGYTDE